MPSALRTAFASLTAPARGVLIVFADDALRLGSATQAVLKPAGDLVTRAASADGFKGKSGSALDIVDGTRGGGGCNEQKRYADRDRDLV